ncbi:MAG: hypothetical protein QF464_07390, partial [Myxococcota bacterium]|nr:hypothetical protein [Myxococcota bacterium]
MRRINTMWTVAVAATLLWSSQATALVAAPCSDDNPCADGMSCFGGDCLPTCASDEDCGEGFDCLIASTADPLPKCDPDDPDCEEGSSQTQADEGVCIELPQACTSDADCDEGEVCEWGPTFGTGTATEPAMPPEEGGGSGEGESDDTPMPGGEGDTAPQEGSCVPGNTWVSECETDDDCPSGMICDEVGSATTVVSDAACICPDGEPDCDCGEGFSEPAPEPETTTYYACVPAPCDTDADCGDGLVCITNIYEICEPGVKAQPCAEEDPDCDGDTEPPAEDPAPECETLTESYCGPKYLANCEIDSDCGEGFTCVEEEICGCAVTGVQVPPSSTETDDVPEEEGSSSDSAGAPGGATEPTEPEGDDEEDEDCSCEPTGEMICELQELPCQSDDDCAFEGWTCQMAGLQPSVPCSFDSESGEEDCGDIDDDPAMSAGQCVPSTWDWNSRGSDVGFNEAANTGDGTTGGGEGPAAPDPTDDGDDGDGSGSGSGDDGSGDDGSGG